MATPAIDYDALAKQHGAVTPEVDYDALAKQHGAVSSGPANPGETPDAAAKPPSDPRAKVGAQVMDFFSHLASGLNPVNMVTGTRDTLNSGLTSNPLDTAKNLNLDSSAQQQKIIDSVKQGDYLSAVRHLAGLLPFLGPAIDNAGDQSAAGHVGAGSGDAAAIALPIAAGMRPSSPVTGSKAAAASKTARSQYGTALKPRVNTPIADVRDMVNTGLEHGITIDENGTSKLQGLIQDLSQKIDAKTKAASQRGVTIDPAAVAQRVDQVRANQNLQVNPVRDVRTADAAKQEFLNQHTPVTPPPPKPSGLLGPNGQPLPASPPPPAPKPTPIPVDVANQIKQGTYKKLAGKYGDLSSDAQVESEKALARGVKEEISAKIPELEGDNNKLGKFLDLQPVIEASVNRAANSGEFSRSMKSMAVSGLTNAVTGHPAVAVAAGVVQKILADPAVRSRLAIRIYQAQQNNPGKFGPPSMKAALAKVAAYAGSLNQSQAGTAQGDAAQP